MSILSVDEVGSLGVLSERICEKSTYCKPSFVRGVLILRFLDKVLIHSVLYSKGQLWTPYFMTV